LGGAKHLARESFMPSTLGNGKVRYLEIPAIDVGRSAAFYQAVVGWRSRPRGDGTLAFDDGADLPEITAWFRDPAGNVFGLYQQPARTASAAE
jgi:hypothetical protein